MSVGCGVIRRLNFLGDNFWVIGVYLYMGLDEKSDFMELVGVGQKDWGINPARPQNSEADGELLGWVDRMGGN
ncbi:11781_t:CDS:2 [Paraglomus brasilianum]|uniref:11781_t:CDS:1 n=1 Tax=Paraglomus brasilianum TaxID=144538 RepID=A0A9N8WM73_9GLOM|nr:11781_t:CDS:2 [Paraglomus brasilianum]